jgi:DNA-binding NarL/FixJ family response regulator
MAILNQNLSALIINPDAYKRMLLKQATTLMPELQKVYQASSLREGMSRIENLEQCDVVFMSSDLPTTECEEFIEKTLLFKQSQDAAFVVVLDSKDQNVGNVAETLLGGANGVLLAPFCVEDLTSVIELASYVRKQRVRARMMQALRILIDESVNKLDVIWYNLCQGQPAGPAIRDLKNASNVIRGLEGEEAALYFEMIQDILPALPVPPPVVKREATYTGASSRVRKLLEMKKKAFSINEGEQKPPGDSKE